MYTFLLFDKLTHSNLSLRKGYYVSCLTELKRIIKNTQMDHIRISNIGIQKPVVSACIILLL